MIYRYYPVYYRTIILYNVPIGWAIKIYNIKEICQFDIFILKYLN